MSAATTEISAEEYAKFQEWKATNVIEIAIAEATADHHKELEFETQAHERRLADENASFDRKKESLKHNFERRIAAMRTIRHTPAIPTPKQGEPVPESAAASAVPPEKTVAVLMEQITYALANFGPDHILPNGNVVLNLSFPCEYPKQCSSLLSAALKDRLGYTLELTADMYPLTSKAHYWVKLSPCDNCAFGVEGKIVDKLKQSNTYHGAIHNPWHNTRACGVDVVNRVCFMYVDIKDTD